MDLVLCGDQPFPLAGGHLAEHRGDPVGGTRFQLGAFAVPGLGQLGGRVTDQDQALIVELGQLPGQVGGVHVEAGPQVGETGAVTDLEQQPGLHERPGLAEVPVGEHAEALGVVAVELADPLDLLDLHQQMLGRRFAARETNHPTFWTGPGTMGRMRESFGELAQFIRELQAGGHPVDRA